LREHVKLDAQTSALQPRKRRRNRRSILLAGLAAGVSLLAGAAPALASENYGEVNRFGSYDTSAYNGGTYDGALTPGAFVDPTAFAVDVNDPDTPDHMAVYVLDRTTPGATTSMADRTGESRWRLQKLDTSGQMLGVATFTLPDGSTAANFPRVGSVAIDHPEGDPAGHVYAMIRSVDGTTVQQIISWSTATTSDRKLETPSDLPATNAPTATLGSNSAGVLSDSTQLGSTIINPRAIAIAGRGDTRSLAVLGWDTTSGGARITDIDLHASGSAHVGDLGATWSTSAASSDPLAPPNFATFAPADNGLSTNPDGSLTLTLIDGGTESRTGTGASNDIVNIAGDFSSQRILLSTENESFGEDGEGLLFTSIRSQLDQWAAISTPLTRRTNGGPTPVVQLSDGRTYASPYVADITADDVPAWNYHQTTQLTNLAVRLLQPLDAGTPWDGTLSEQNVPDRGIVDTVGDTSGLGKCALTMRGGVGPALFNMGVARGNDQSVFVLMGGANRGTSNVDVTTSRYVLELKPNASGDRCSQPEGNFSASTDDGSGNLTPIPGVSTGEVTVPVATRVVLDGAGLDYKGAWVSAYDWDVDGTGYPDEAPYSPFDLASLPAPLNQTATKLFDTPGVFPIRMRAIGDFGVTERELSVVVQARDPPTATFTVGNPDARTGDDVTFDASGSTPSEGARIAGYQWDYGDHNSDVTNGPLSDHVYTQAGHYTVTLTVRGNDQQVSHEFTQDVTVTDPSAGCAENCGGGCTSDCQQPCTVNCGSGDPDSRDNNNERRNNDVPPPAGDTTAPSITLKAASVRGNLSLTIGCPAGESSCAGTVKLTVKQKVKKGKGKRAKTITKTVVVGKATFSLAGGQKKAVTVKLNGTGRSLLRKSKSLKVQLAVAVHDAAGNRATKNASATIKPAPAKKTKKPGRR
jgi:PKD repeat protein